MSTIVIRPIDSTNSHLNYNRNVQPTQPVIEFARFGSVLINHAVAIAVLESAFLGSPGISVNPDDIRDLKTAHRVLNFGLRAATQREITRILRKPTKSHDTATEIVAKHLPGLIVDNG